MATSETFRKGEYGFTITDNGEHVYLAVQLLEAGSVTNVGGRPRYSPPKKPEEIILDLREALDKKRLNFKVDGGQSQGNCANVKFQMLTRGEGLHSVSTEEFAKNLQEVIAAYFSKKQQRSGDEDQRSL